MDIKEFISGIVEELDEENFNGLKSKLVGEYLKFSFVDEGDISREVFCEKLADYFEKTVINTSNEFAKILKKYVANLDDIINGYLPKEPSAKKGEPAPQTPRSLKYYKYAAEIMESNDMMLKQLTDYSRIMISLYMGVINAEMQVVSGYEFATDNLDIDRIINAMLGEKSGIGFPLGKKKMFDLEEMYSTDASTIIITIMMFYYIKNKEVGEEI